MTKIRALRLQPTVEARDDARQVLHESGDAVIVERGKPRWLVLKCPCGCSDDISVNLDSRTGPAWRLYDTGRGLTVYPSVWRESGCLSHFIIWNGQILWLDSYDQDFFDAAMEDEVLAVMSRLPKHFAAVAEELSAIPWEVLAAAHALAKRGMLIEGTGAKQGWFNRINY